VLFTRLSGFSSPPHQINLPSVLGMLPESPLLQPAPRTSTHSFDLCHSLFLMYRVRFSLRTPFLFFILFNNFCYPTYPHPAPSSFSISDCRLPSGPFAAVPVPSACFFFLVADFSGLYLLYVLSNTFALFALFANIFL